MSSHQSVTGLICTTCGDQDCRRSACNGPTQRHVTEAEWNEMRAPSSRRPQLFSPELTKLNSARKLLAKIPESDTRSVTVARTMLRWALEQYASELERERAELERTLTRDQLIDRDMRINDEMLNLVRER